VHSKLDYCNSFILNLPHSQLNRLQLILNSSARTVSLNLPNSATSFLIQSFSIGSKFNSFSNIKSYLSPTKLFCLDNLHISSLFNVQSNRTTRSSDIITLQRPSVRSRLKVTERSFTHHAPVGLLWNSLHKQLRQRSAPQSFGDSTPLLALSSP